MNENSCNLEKGEGKKLIISNIQLLSPRNMTKLNIFLDTLKNIIVNSEDNKIIIDLEVEDDNSYVVIIQKIYDYLKSLSADCCIDNSLFQQIEQLQQLQQLQHEKKEELKSIKKNKSLESLSFEDFCFRTDTYLKIKLRDYQYKSAFLFVTGNGGFEFSVPGSGKTIITYAAYAHFKKNNSIDKILIIGPNNAYNAWWDEYKTCFGEYPNFENLAPQNSESCKSYFLASSKNHKEITFINYDKIRLLESEICVFLKSSRFLLIFDEAHYIKNPKAITTQKAISITRYATFRILLTGTPMPNGYEDLFSLTKIFSPFEDIIPYRYEQLRSMTKNDASENQIQNIKEAIFPYYSRISKKYLISINELKNPNYHIINCYMDDNQVALYNKLDSFCGKTQDYSFDENLLQSFKKAILIRKMQISANPSLLKRSLIKSMDELFFSEDTSERKEQEFDNLVKVDREIMKSFQSSEIIKLINSYDKLASSTGKNKCAIELVNDFVKRNQKILVWDIFVNNMFALYDELRMYLFDKVELICGAIPLNERQEAIKRFREGDSMVLIANPATLAESISLHRCCQNAIYVNRNFNAAQFIQSKDRIHRINMPEGTTASYYFLENNNSVDNMVDEKLSKKERRMLEILDADDIIVGGSEFEDYSIMSDSDIEDCYRK